MRGAWENSVTFRCLARVWLQLRPSLAGAAGWLWRAAGDSLLFRGTRTLARKRIYPVVQTSLLYRALRWLVLDLVEEG